MEDNMKMTLGADPEFYVVHRDTRKPVSAHDLVPGTKAEPSPLPNGGAVQVDGVAVEFNIPPASTAKEFSDGIKSALNDIRKIIPDKYEFQFLPVVDFDKVYFDSLPDPVKVLGCDPDLNAYTGVFNRSPSDEIQNSPTRAFGGHIHIGWGSDMKGDVHKSDCIAIIKQIEGTIGTPSYATNPTDRVLNSRRTSMYGNNGSMRVKPYGVEWRAPSNLWLKYGEASWKSIFTCIDTVFYNMTSGGATRTIRSFYLPSHY
jgi:hypothetical protein